MILNYLKNIKTKKCLPVTVSRNSKLDKAANSRKFQENISN